MCLLKIPCICTFSILNYTKMHGSSAEVLPKIQYTEVYVNVLKWNSCKYTSGTL